MYNCACTLYYMKEKFFRLTKLLHTFSEAKPSRFQIYPRADAQWLKRLSSNEVNEESGGGRNKETRDGQAPPEKYTREASKDRVEGSEKKKEKCSNRAKFDQKDWMAAQGVKGGLGKNRAKKAFSPPVILCPEGGGGVMNGTNLTSWPSAKWQRKTCYLSFFRGREKKGHFVPLWVGGTNRWVELLADCSRGWALSGRSSRKTSSWWRS